MASGPLTSWQTDGEKMETVTNFIFLDSKITTDSDCSLEVKRHLLPGRKAMTNLVQFSSVAQSWPTLCDPMDCSMPSLPVHHQLLESTQTHVHWVSDAIHCPLLLPPRQHIKKQRHHFADKGLYRQSYVFFQ